MTQSTSRHPPVRVDVLSVKGGVGKTTLSILVAHAQAKASNRPVLIIDADLTGTCLGHLLDPAAHPDWGGVRNLAHLICDPPESLGERLTGAALPVYLHEPTRAAATPARSIAIIDSSEMNESRIIYCPSHGDSTDPTPVDRPILQAMVGHETAGGWVRYVIAQVIDEVARRVEGGLGGVVVDHSPGVAALQACTLAEIDAEPIRRRALLVTTSDRVDLKMMGALCASEKGRYDREPRRGLSTGEAWMEGKVWAISRAARGWRDDRYFREEFGGERWLDTAYEIGEQEALRVAYRTSASLAAAAAAPSAAADQIERLRSALFGAIHG